MKKIPERMCIACRNVVPKNQLTRIVRNKDEQVFIDKTGKAQGRGAYVCDNIACMEKIIKTKALNRIFEIDLDKTVYDALMEEYIAKKQG